MSTTTAVKPSGTDPMQDHRGPHGETLPIQPPRRLSSAKLDDNSGLVSTDLETARAFKRESFKKISWGFWAIVGLFVAFMSGKAVFDYYTDKVTESLKGDVKNLQAQVDTLKTQAGTLTTQANSITTQVKGLETVSNEIALTASSARSSAAKTEIAVDRGAKIITDAVEKVVDPVTKLNTKLDGVSNNLAVSQKLIIDSQVKLDSGIAAIVTNNGSQDLTNLTREVQEIGKKVGGLPTASSTPHTTAKDVLLRATVAACQEIHFKGGVKYVVDCGGTTPDIRASKWKAKKVEVTSNKPGVKVYEYMGLFMTGPTIPNDVPMGKPYVLSNEATGAFVTSKEVAFTVTVLD